MLFTIKNSVFVLSTLLLAAGCDAASTDDGAARVREVVAGAEVSLAAAIDAAAAAAPAAVVVEAELEVEAAAPVYEVRVVADGTLTKIHVDPETGAVLRSEVDENADDVAEAQAAAALLQGATLDAAAAIATAEAQRSGSVAFEFSLKDSLIEVEVIDDVGLFEVHLDPADGSVVAVEASDDHGDGDGEDAAGDDDGGKDAAGDDDGGDSAEPGDDNGGTA